jgi:CBS domain-containing protein
LGSKASVEYVMRSPPVTVIFSETVSSIAEKMTSSNIGAVIVMKGGVPTGIITEKDIIAKVVRNHKDPEKTLAQDVMSSPLISVEVNTNVKDALKLMRLKEIRRLAITREKRLVGLVSERRLIDSLI